MTGRATRLGAERPPPMDGPRDGVREDCAVEGAIATFRAEAVRVGAVVHETPGAATPARAAQILRDAGCRTVAVAAAVPDRGALVQALLAAGLSEIPCAGLRPTRRADAGVSVATLGVAETGSALLHATSDDRRAELCVDVHLILLDAARLVLTLDAAFTTLRDIAARPPAYATLVTGPSRSADIERHLTVGVHGPRAVHVLLRDG